MSKELNTILTCRWRVPASKLMRLMRREGYKDKEDFVNEVIMPLVMDETEFYINSLD